MFWLYYFGFLIFIIIVVLGHYFLIERRRYKVINGKVHVKEGISKWEPLVEHMKREHPKWK